MLRMSGVNDVRNERYDVSDESDVHGSGLSDVSGKSRDCERG